MDRATAQRWLDDYVSAWKSYDRDDIAALFAEDVAYRFHPSDELLPAVVDTFKRIAPMIDYLCAALELEF